MNPHRTRDSILTVIGFAALLIYILACASFSPDDSQILFPSWDPSSGSLLLSVYDRSARTSQTLLVLPIAESGWVRPGWTADGRRIIAIWTDDSSNNNRLQVALLPFRAKEPPRILGVSDIDEITASTVYPPQLLGSSLFLTAQPNVVRLDLNSGAVLKKEIGEGVQVVVRQGRLIYHRKLAEEAGGAGPRWEVGRLDEKTLECSPIFQTTEGDEQGPFAPDAAGSRFALEIKKDDRFRVLIFDGSRLAATIPFGTEADKLEPGNLVWSRDGSTLYAVYTRPLADEEHHEFGVIELPVGGGPGRQIPLFGTGSVDDMDSWMFQIDLSHDGKTLAGASTYLWKDNEEKLKAADLALYLVDLGRADRRVTKIPIAPPKPRPGAEKQ